MKIFAIADLHLSFHENIDKPMSIFGAGWEDYEKRLSDYWHELISPEDVVILPETCPGDSPWRRRFRTWSGFTGCRGGRCC